MTRFKMLLMLIAVSVVYSSVMSRPTLGPPSIKLKSNISHVALMELTAVDANGRLSFQLVEDIHNESKPQLRIQTNQQMSQSLTLNKNYIVGYMAWQTDRFTKQVSPRKGGPVLMNLPGAEPALLLANPDLIEMLKLDAERLLQSDKGVLKMIKAGLNSHDPQTLNFFVTELITRKKLHQKRSVKKLIKSLLLDPKLAWKTKRFILAHNGLSDKQLASEWYCQFVTNTLNYASNQVDQHGSDSGLIIQLIEKHKQCKPTDYPIELSRWVTSNHTGVVEAAIKIMRANDLDAAISTVKNTLDFSILKQQNRLTLNNYLKRLNNEKMSLKTTN